MSTYTTKISINADKSRIWSVLADVEQWSKWTASIEKIEPLEVSPLKNGSKVRILQPKLRPAIWEITEWCEGQNFTWVSNNPGMRVEATHTIVEKDGGCEVVLGVKTEGFLAPLVGLLAGKLTQEYMAMEAAGLKKQCEQ